MSAEKKSFSCSVVAVLIRRCRFLPESFQPTWEWSRYLSSNISPHGDTIYHSQSNIEGYNGSCLHQCTLVSSDFSRQLWHWCDGSNLSIFQSNIVPSGSGPRSYASPSWVPAASCLSWTSYQSSVIRLFNHEPFNNQFPTWWWHFTYTTMLKLVNKLTFSSLIVPCLPLGAAPNPSPHLATMTKYVVTRLGCQIRIMALAISLLTCNRVDT